MIAHNCSLCHYVACKGECGCRGMHSPLDVHIHGEWKPADAEQAEGRMFRSGRGHLRTEDEERYLEAYGHKAREIHDELQYTGWARAKGLYKSQITYLVHCPVFVTSVEDHAATDAILDGMGC